MYVFGSKNKFCHAMLGTHCQNANFGTSLRFGNEKCINEAKILCIINNPVQEDHGECGNHSVTGHIIKVCNLKWFKRELKSFLLHHAYYSVDEFLSSLSAVDSENMTA
jgi:hypothetical protein